MSRRVQPENLDHSDRLKAINPLLYFCTALGLLPVKVNITKTGHGNSMITKAVYQFSAPAFALTIIVLISLAYVIYLVTKFERHDSVITRLHLKIMLYGDTGVAAINLLSLLFYRFQKTVSCLNTAVNKLFSLNYYSRLPTSCYWFLLTLAFSFATRMFIYGDTVEHAMNILLGSAINFMPFSVLGVVIILNTIIETSYRDINEQLLRFGCQQHCNNVSHCQTLLLWNRRDAMQNQRHRQSVVQDLMTEHYKIGDLMLDVCSCFNIDVLATCCSCTIKIILLTYMVYLYVVYTISPLKFYVVLVSDVLLLVCIMCITAISCENVTLQYKETEKILMDILMREFRTIDENTRYIIEVFLFQIKCRKIEFSVFGIFILNRSLFYDMVSTCIAFIVVLIQFRSN